jgi:hypothetical protein
LSDESPLFPATTTTVFRSRRCSGLPNDVIPAFYVKTTPLSSVTLTNPDTPDDLTGVVGASQVFMDTAVALFAPGGGAPTNQVTLDALAKQIATAFYDWRSWSQDTVFNGIAAIEPTALWDCIEFRYDAVDSFTRVQSQPFNGETQELQHFDPATADCSDANNPTNCLPTAKTPYIEIYGAPSNCNGGTATAVAVVVDGAVTQVNLTSNVTGISVTAVGSGYTSSPVVTLSGGGGCGAIANVLTSAGAVSGITVVNGGSGYTAAPTVTLTGGGGAGATATATIGTGGAGYTGAPIVAFSHIPGDGTGAVATATIAGDSVAAVTLVPTVVSVTPMDGGSGYTSVPTVMFSGGGGTGAAATATISAGKVTGYTITNGGTGYTSNPTVMVSGGGGTGATATAIAAPGGSGYSADNPPLVSFYGGYTLLARTAYLVNIEDGRLIRYFSHYDTIG